jgi:signal transduction histidine kinase
MLRIRDEQAAQLALTASERSLIESQRLAGIAHFERDLRSNAVTWSENMYVMHGVDPRTFVPCRATLLDLIVSEDRARMLFRLEMIDQQRETVGTVETKIRLPSGETRNIQYGWRLLGGQDGTRPRIFGIAKDMTAMRAAEATIRNDEERLRDIVECSGDYIWESNAAGTVTFFSGEPKRIDFMSDIVRMETGPSTVRSDSEALRHAIDARVKFRNLVVPANDEDGELVWVRVSANPRFDEQGNFLGYRGAGTDVTDVKHEQERDEHRRKSEALGRLAGGLAHEINNLLQPILIYAAFGASSRAGDVQQYFSRIARAAEQATLIVKNVLTSARQSPPLRENVDVQAVIRETADLLSGTLPQGVALEIVCEADDIFVRVDRTGLAQLLTNLVTNASEALAEAARATGQKSGRIEVSAALVLLSAEAARAFGLQPAAYCRLCVADDGPGIVREHIDKVFEPFFTTKPQGKGTGLGLSVVSGLAKSWGGTVSVASTPGESTRFVVYLPLAERQLQAAQ